MHIVHEDLEKLEKAFEEKYHRPLKGTNLGQFHSDFTSFNGREDVQCAVESLFLMNTHTQCVFHIIRLRLIIFHTPKNFHGRNKIE